jgi:hypothetical protein
VSANDLDRSDFQKHGKRIVARTMATQSSGLSTFKTLEKNYFWEF